MSGNSIYTVRILNKRVFRLLFILPASDRNQQLECYCLPFNIDDAPAYEALSYAWGESTSSIEIRCNGQPVTIRSELSHAWTKLRSPDTTRIIWADALCINQNDSAEKSHQVPLMGSIYSLAKRVVIWLGQGNEEQIAEAFAYSTYIANACLNYDEERGLLRNHKERYKALSLPKDLFRESSWKSLKELYKRPWFSRVWCVQEIRLAQDALVLWGDHEISWECLSLAASWIFDKGISQETSDFEVPSDVQQFVSYPDTLRDKDLYPLLIALFNFRDFESTDPRDKVYGLLNLLKNQSEVDALGLSYDKSVGEVYADTVLAVIRVHSRLDAFAYITHPPNYDPGDEDNLKSQHRSWAPRWDIWAAAEMLGISKYNCPWNPYGDNETVVMGDHNPRPEELCLVGVLYDRVCDVEEIMYYKYLKDPVSNSENPARPGNNDMVTETGSRPEDTNTLFDIFNRVFVESNSEVVHRAWARTLTAGSWDRRARYIENLDPAAGESYYRAYHRFMCRRKELQLTGTEGSFAHDEDSTQFERTVYSACGQRRLFWTDNMTFGLGPQCMQPGDIVVVLYGGNTPYILRPKGDKYLFMGQAYVDDIMRGEMFSGSEEYEEKTFCLV
ncbi:hypothetical protein yc1106_01304 [Curvularia clavata]|uniref:Heterokaryon incompatibility domain-containing protein n=1 Tax=Curvularia clavata TaxID=95742 RepID=A0A9Q8Z2M3_CURCL|nr:hypothetical protein yc1106_01304 [Curvularia clavata]